MIEAREVVSLPLKTRLPVSRWREVLLGTVLYEADDLAHRFTRDKIVQVKTEVKEGDSIEIGWFFVDVPLDMAEGQSENIGHFETDLIPREKVAGSYPRVWRSGKPLRDYQLRVK